MLHTSKKSLNVIRLSHIWIFCITKIHSDIVRSLTGIDVAIYAPSFIAFTVSMHVRDFSAILLSILCYNVHCAFNIMENTYKKTENRIPLSKKTSWCIIGMHCVILKCCKRAIDMSRNEKNAWNENKAQHKKSSKTTLT